MDLGNGRFPIDFFDSMPEDHFKAWESLAHDHPEVYARWLKKYLIPNDAQGVANDVNEYLKMFDTHSRVSDEFRDELIAKIGTGHSWLWMMEQLYCYPWEDRVHHKFEDVIEKTDKDGYEIHYPVCSKCGFKGMGWYPLI